MTKADLIAAVAAKTGLPKTEAAKLVDLTLARIIAALRSGDEVRLPAFGKFVLSHRRARTGRNPRTGATIAISATTLPRFRPSSVLRAMLDGKPVTRP